MLTRPIRASALALALSAGWALPAHASTASDAAIQQELAAMRSQMAQMASRIDSLEGELGDARAKAAAAEAKANAAANAASAAAAAIPAQIAQAAPTATAKPATEIAWDGAPKFSTGNGWSFKPRGRLQVDIGSVNLPASVNSKDKGVATEFRRAYIGFDGTMPGNFGYRFEADLGDSSVKFTDVYLTYKPNPKLTLTLGQHKPFGGLEEMTSDLYTSMMERATFTSAFGFERRVGLSAAYAGKDVLVQAGLFADDAAALNTSTNNSFSIDGRVVFMPKIGKGQLHIGGSAHYRKLGDLTSSISYAARPFIHTSDLRLINTGSISNTTGERGLGLEAAYIAGRFHASAESFWQTALRSGLPNPTFNGGYAELGYLLTDDTTAYKGGVYDRIKPKHPVGKGGLGAIQVNLRYDWLDLNSGAILGGRQQVAGVSALWMPTDYVRFILNYGHLWIDDAAVPAGADRAYNGDVMGLRAQFDF